MQNFTYTQALKKAKNPLVLAVGGGNDSVSTLFLQTQLRHEYGYNPKSISIVAVLPDCLDYHGLTKTEHPLISVITEDSTRSVQGHTMSEFPEKMLAANLKNIPELQVNTVYGISMREGSSGVANALQQLVSTEKFDLILAIDVGGDFIAVEENVGVLSPMMDGYMLHALRMLNMNNTKNIPIIYSVFGLGTDGESTPEMLHNALSRLPDLIEGRYDPLLLKDIFSFYRTKIEPNRKSRTADFTIREIDGTGHENPAVFRGRFHVQQDKDVKASVHYGTYEHVQDPSFFAKYYLFSDLSQVHNPYAFACSSGVTWFMRVQNSTTKINHELNGQAYMDLGCTMQQSSLAGVSLFFGTPSNKFDDATQKLIAKQVITSVHNNVYDMALVYEQLATQMDDLLIKPVENGLALVGKNIKTMQTFIQLVSAIKPA